MTAGEVLTYTLVYTNAGPSDTQSVIITDTLPVSVTYGGMVNVTPSLFGPTQTGQLLTWYTPTLVAGTLGSAIFTVTVDIGASGTITNSAVITSVTHDPSPSDNDDDEMTDIVASHFTTIYGTVFQDTNGDGVRNAGKPGIPGVLVTLDRAITTTTDLNGNYTFPIIVSGTHTVIETDLTSHTPTMFNERCLDSGDMSPTFNFVSSVGGKTDLPSYSSTTPNEVHVNVTLGTSYRVDFGDMLTNSGFAALYGTVFNDANGDGVLDAGELGIPGVLVTLDGVITATTDLNGTYTFSTTVAGIHIVLETDPDGYLSTTPNEVYVDVNLGTGYQVDLGDALTNSGFAALHGTVFNDADGDGVRDADELGISGVTVTLNEDTAVTTGPYGGYVLSATVAGVHIILETDPDDYLSTTPNEVYVDATLGSSYQVDFGDMPLKAHTCDADVYEEDDTAAQAMRFVVGTTQAHQFCDDSTDWVKFAAKANAVYTITTSSWGRRADTLLTLFDTDGHTLLAANDDYEGTTDYSSRIVWQAPANSLYYARTTNRGGLTGDYTDYDLMIEGKEPSTIYLPIVMRNYKGGSGTNSHNAVLHLTGIITHTCPDAYETDDTWQQAHAIEVEDVQVHSLDSDPEYYAADKDFVWFDVSTRSTVIFTVAPVTNTQTLMELYDEHGAVLVMTDTTRLVWIPTASGRYYLSVSPEDGTTSFGCADAVGYNLLMETLETNIIYLPVAMRSL